MSWPLRYVVLAFLTVSVSGTGTANEFSWERQQDRSVALKAGEEVVWQFNHDSQLPKPYFHPVALPTGPVLTWDRPPDHVWHHGLWFSWKFINGLNYWEPNRQTGKPEGRTAWDHVQVTTRPDFSARVSVDLSYGPQAGDAIMTEERVIEVSPPDRHGTYHFDWTCTFTSLADEVQLDRTPLEDEPGGRPWGGYAGLSIRLARDILERSAVTDQGPVDFGSKDRFRGKASVLEYQGIIGDQAVGIAVCDHPKNLNHPSPWYVIRARPMSYFSPAVICYGPHTIAAGESLTLRYRVIVHRQRWDAERLSNAYRKFAVVAE
jgi:hypothetical protein